MNSGEQEENKAMTKLPGMFWSGETLSQRLKTLIDPFHSVSGHFKAFLSVMCRSVLLRFFADEGGPDDEQGQTDEGTPFGGGVAIDHGAFRAQRSDGGGVLSGGVAGAEHVLAVATEAGWR